ncbi:MAG: dihydrofolate reductase family protein [Aquihabitans sp.]
MLLGTQRARLGDERGLTLVEDALARFAATGNKSGGSLGMSMPAEAYFGVGRHHDAIGAAEHGVAAGEMVQQAFCDTELVGLRGRALVEFAREHVLQPGYDFGDEFAVGLTIVLDGIASSTELRPPRLRSRTAAIPRLADLRRSCQCGRLSRRERRSHRFERSRCFVLAGDDRRAMSFDSGYRLHGMGTISATYFISLDGVISSPETFTGPDFGSKDLGEVIERLDQSHEVFVIGRKQYDEWSQHWTNEGKDDQYASFINEVEKVVISDSLDDATWNNTRIVRRADAAGELRRLRAERTGTIGTWGSLTVVRWMAQNELIDRLHLIVVPTVVGDGQHLFPELATKELHPVETQMLSGGVQSLVLDVR